MTAKRLGLSGDRMKAARERIGMTQEDLAARIGKAQTHIWRYEAGKVNPSSEVLARIAEELEVSSDYLLGLVDEPHQNVTEEPLSPMQRRLLWALNKGLIPEALEAFTSITKGEN